jgi:hypothetical protein
LNLRVIAVAIALTVSVTCLAQPTCPTFTRTTCTGAGVDPFAGAAEDFNGDGRSDLAVFYNNSGGVQIFLGQTNGTLLPFGTYLPPSTSVSALHAADVNGDGHIDLIVGYGLDVQVLDGNGDGTFVLGPIVHFPSGAAALDAGDFDGDGRTDIVASLANRNLFYIRQQANGTLAAPVLIAAAPFTGGIDVADFDGNGALDIIGASDANVFVIVTNNGNANFDSPVAYLIGPPVSGVVADVVTTDYNHDGYPDAAVGVIGQGVVLMRNNGNRTFTPTLHLAAGAAGSSVETGDFNSDGLQDVVVSDYNGFDVLLAKADGTYEAPRFTSTGLSLTAVSAPLVVGDFRGLGRSDVALATRLPFNQFLQTIDTYLNGCVNPAALPTLSPLAALIALLSLAAAGFWMLRRA